MTVKFRSVDDNHYVMNVSVSESGPGQALKWEGRGASHFAIIKGRYGQNLDLAEEGLQEKIAGALESGKFAPGKQVKLDGALGAYLMPYAEYIQKNAKYDIPTQSSSYAVFSCSHVGDDYVFFVPNRACNYQINISAAADVRVSPLKTGFFKKLSGYTIEIAFDEKVYSDGVFYYTVSRSACKYPVTAAMLNKKLYVAAEPKVFSADSGIEIRSAN
ncbi:MAG: hypothetical protein LBC56_04070 [Oscillospiraceae bacterium]|jgi:hypothetical protein|nr:hypothetical protein [Oscillospiraceae bacterium]